MKKNVLKQLENRRLLFVVSLLIIIHSVFTIFIAFVLESLVDTAVALDLLKLKKILVFIVGYLFVFFILTKLLTMLKNNYVCQQNIMLHNYIINNILKKNVGSFQKLGVGKGLSVLMNDLDIIENNYYHSRFNFISYIATFVFGIVAMIVIDIKMAIIVIVLSAIPMIFSMLFCSPLDMQQKSYSDFFAKYSISLKNALSNFNLIKVFNLEDRLEAEVDYQFSEKEEKKKIFSNRRELAQGYSSLLGTCIVLAVFGTGAFFVINGEMRIGELLAFIQLMNYVLSPVQGMSFELNNIKSCRGIIDSFDTLEEKEIEDGKYKFPKCNEIKLVNVSYSFDGKKVLNNIDLLLETGKKYVILGSNGSGKSTLISIISRFYEDYEGNVFFDGINSREIDATSFHKNAVLLQQDVLILRDTVKNNILLYKNDNNFDRVVSTLEIEYLVNSEELCLDNGNNLSGGEKQKIAVARALLSDPKILMLDESFSALDPKSRGLLEKTVLTSADIVISVSHDYSEQNLLLYDEIIYLDEGRIVAKGPYYEMIKKINLQM